MTSSPTPKKGLSRLLSVLEIPVLSSGQNHPLIIHTLGFFVLCLVAVGIAIFVPNPAIQAVSAFAAIVLFGVSMRYLILKKANLRDGKYYVVYSRFDQPLRIIGPGGLHNIKIWQRVKHDHHIWRDTEIVFNGKDFAEFVDKDGYIVQLKGRLSCRFNPTLIPINDLQVWLGDEIPEKAVRDYIYIVVERALQPVIRKMSSDKFQTDEAYDAITNKLKESLFPIGAKLSNYNRDNMPNKYGVIFAESTLHAYFGEQTAKSVHKKQANLHEGTAKGIKDAAHLRSINDSDMTLEELRKLREVDNMYTQNRNYTYGPYTPPEQQQRSVGQRQRQDQHQPQQQANPNQFVGQPQQAQQQSSSPMPDDFVAPTESAPDKSQRDADEKEKLVKDLIDKDEEKMEEKISRLSDSHGELSIRRKRRGE